MNHRKSSRLSPAPKRAHANSSGNSSQPPFTAAERRLIARLRTPEQVQAFLNRLPYNTEPPPERDTLRSFRQVLRRCTAHCLEAALFAACVLEQHGYPPLVMSMESADLLDHVVFVFRRRGRWGAIGRSRDPGLHGRKAVFRTPRALASSYFDAFVDYTGSLTGYAVADLGVLDGYDWRLADRNMWKIERMLNGIRHARLPRRPERVRALRKRYRAYREAHGMKPLYYSGRDKWLPIPREFLHVNRRRHVAA